MEVGVRERRTRARNLAEEAGTSDAVKRRRKLDNEDEESRVSSPLISASREIVSQDFVQEPEIAVECRRLVDRDRFQCPSSDQDHSAASESCCSSNRSREKGNESIGNADQDEDSAEVETSTYFSRNERSETTLVQEESNDMDSKTKRSDAVVKSSAGESRSRSTAGKNKQTVSEAEVEEFFSAREKELHDKILEFTKKYNFDFVKEEPLEGRYEWVRLKQ